MTRWKYIGWDGPDGLPQVVVFPPTLQHADMVPQDVTPKSAGFVTAGMKLAEVESRVEVVCAFIVSGYSESLDLSPRSADADAFAMAQ